MTNIYEGSGGEFAAAADEPGEEPYPLLPLPPLEEMTPEHVAMMRAMDAALERWEGKGPVQIELATHVEAWILLGFLQVANRMDHPFRGLVMKIGRRLQEQVCDAPELREIAESGWRGDGGQ